MVFRQKAKLFDRAPAQAVPLFIHAALFIFFSGAARAGVISADFFCVAYIRFKIVPAIDDIIFWPFVWIVFVIESAAAIRFNFPV